MTHPSVKGQWMPADTSSNTLEVAETDQNGVFALRDTYDQQEVIFATDRQIRSLADAVQKGRLTTLP
jgi:hypothetical protein